MGPRPGTRSAAGGRRARPRAAASGAPLGNHRQDHSDGEACGDADEVGAGSTPTAASTAGRKVPQYLAPPSGYRRARPGGFGRPAPADWRSMTARGYARRMVASSRPPCTATGTACAVRLPEGMPKTTYPSEPPTAGSTVTSFLTPRTGNSNGSCGVEASPLSTRQIVSAHNLPVKEPEPGLDKCDRRGGEPRRRDGRPRVRWPQGPKGCCRRSLSGRPG